MRKINEIIIEDSLLFAKSIRKEKREKKMKEYYRRVNLLMASKHSNLTEITKIILIQINQIVKTNSSNWTIVLNVIDMLLSVYVKANGDTNVSSVWNDARQ
jgi:hypothetical protein